MRNNIVNLCFVTDKGYSMPTCVALVSALKNKNPSSVYNIYILYKDLDSFEIKNLMKLDCEKFNVVLINLGKYEDFSSYRLNNVHATPTSIYKFFIPEILADLNKVLFLDGDVLINGDLLELYNVDLKEKYVAAVKDNNGLDHGLYNKDYCYFNSGVMLLNLKKMRDNNTKDTMLEYRKNGINKLMDQDTFNYVFDKSVKLLPFKYNTQTNVLSAIVQKRPGYDVERVLGYWNMNFEKSKFLLNEILDSGVIIHYASVKPWKYYDGFGSSLWYAYYANSPYGSKKLKLDSHYIVDIVNSTTCRFGKSIIILFILLKKFYLSFKYRKYHKFLLKFVGGCGE